MFTTTERILLGFLFLKIYVHCVFKYNMWPLEWKPA